MRATCHDSFAPTDYINLQKLGIRTAREGLRWHLIEDVPGKYDFSSAIEFIRESDKQNIQLIWDLLHFGWPSHVDPFAANFPERFGEFAVAFVRILQRYSYGQIWIAPVNEISFLSWAGGERGYLNPFATNRGAELKRQLVKAGIAAAHAIRGEVSYAKFVWPEPVIHIVGDTPDAEQYRLAMFESWDLIAGLQEADLAGSLELIDVIGINFYERNQWRNFGETIFRGDAEYRPLREIIAEVYNRYRTPMLISETGAENSARASWMAYICDEVDAAVSMGVPVEGICWYPILDHPGWDNGRPCSNGLWGYPLPSGEREIYTPLAREIQAQQQKRGVVCTMNTTELEKSLIDLVCFSHLRWDGVFQRPQHLMSHFANRQRVFYIEEPLFTGNVPQLSERLCRSTGVNVVTPLLPETLRDRAGLFVADLLQDLFSLREIERPIAWFYTPMALDWLPDGLVPSVVAFDCMDELSSFRGAPPEMAINEEKLFGMADVVFTGGRTLYEAKRGRHPNVHMFPSAVDVVHFANAQAVPDIEADQRDLPRPRVGFAGVIDERMDLDLIRQLARRRPEWQFVFLGPVAKINPADLPQGANLHWLGLKDYQSLPSYMAGWDVAMMPFALNESTRNISPTKTPEYLAAGLPVVSTPIRDVVTPYGELGLVQIAHSASEFENCIQLLLEGGVSPEWRARAESFVGALSWEATWSAMAERVVPRLPRFQNVILQNVILQEELASAHV